MQIKELEDGLAEAQQSSAHLQTQLDAASASAQFQAADLASAQAQASQLRAESESLQSQLAEAQRDWQAARDACQTHEGAAADQAQQWTIKVSAVVCKREQCVMQACLPSNSSKQQSAASQWQWSCEAAADQHAGVCNVQSATCPWSVASDYQHAINPLRVCMYEGSVWVSTGRRVDEGGCSSSRGSSSSSPGS